VREVVSGKCSVLSKERGENANAEAQSLQRFVEKREKSRSLHCAARGAKLRRGRKSRAAPVGMTMLVETLKKSEGQCGQVRRRRGAAGCQRKSGRKPPHSK